MKKSISAILALMIVITLIPATGITVSSSSDIRTQFSTDLFDFRSTDEDVSTLEDIRDVIINEFERISNALDAENYELRLAFILYPTYASLTDAVRNLIEDEPTSHGYYISGVSEIHMTAARTNREGLLRLALHEFVHATVDFRFSAGSISMLLHEGVATYLTGEAYGVEYAIGQGIRNNNLPTIQELNNINDDRAYTFGYAFIEFVEETFGMDYIVRLLDGTPKSTVFGMNDDELNISWMEFLNGYPIGAAPHALASFADEMNSVFGDGLFTASDDPISIANARTIFQAIGSEQNAILTGRGTLTRVMACQAIWALCESLGLSQPPANSLTTLPDTDDDAVRYIVGLDVLSPWPDGTFRPYEDLLSAQLPVLLYRIFNLPAIGGLEAAKTLLTELGTDAGNLDIPNLDSADEWAYAEITAAVEAGLISVSILNDDWKTPTSRLVAAEMLVQTIETALSKTMTQLASERGWDLTTGGFVDTDDQAVTFLRHAGVTNGVGDNRYDPDGEYNRAQIVTMIGRSAEVFFGVTAQGDNPFSDVPDWAAPFVAYAADSAITQGVGSGRFDSYGVLQNQHTAVFIYRAVNAWATDMEQ